MEVADICCQGRVISVLEGGYGTYSTAVSAKGSPSCEVRIGHDHHLDRSVFSECALRHLSALVDPYNKDV